MEKPSLLIMSMGELSTNILESLARENLFECIVVGSRDKNKAKERINNAILGSVLEGYYPKLLAEECDPKDPRLSAKIRSINPDFIFTAPSLLPWWKIKSEKRKLPFAASCSLHLLPVIDFRESIFQANTKAIWINGSFPDVINPVLTRTGFGPHCGIGNIQEPIAKLKIGVAKCLKKLPEEIVISLVAQHAFEYAVINAKIPKKFPPYLLKVMVGQKDQTELGEKILREPFPFPYDLHFNRVTASAFIEAVRALISTTPAYVHLPGIKGLIGGYPTLVSKSELKLCLPPEWSIDGAIKVNQDSLKWDGIDSVEKDGNIIFSNETIKALFKLSGKSIETLNTGNVKEQAKEVLKIFTGNE